MKKLFFKLPLLLLLGIVSCIEEQSVQVTEPRTIHGIVVTSDGEPVADANVRVTFDIRTLELEEKPDYLYSGITVYPNPVVNQAETRFTLDSMTEVELYLYLGLTSQKPIKYLFKDTLPASTHLLKFDMRDPQDSTLYLPNGMYTLWITEKYNPKSSSSYSIQFLYNNSYESGAWVKTNPKGEFALNINQSEQNMPFNSLNSVGEVIGKFDRGDSVTVEIYKENMKSVWRTKIKHEEDIYKTFILK
ncbi:MAG: hypothetical protein V4642_07865 [Bacteroidota bacterium]